MKRFSRIGWAARNAVMAERTRARIRQAGVTAKGHPLWTKEEDAKVLRLYPDYKALRRALRRRTYRALRARAGTLGITKKRHTWTAAEASRIRKLYPTANKGELYAAFPGLRWNQIVGKARHIRVRRNRRPLSPTGFPIIDEVRQRAFRLNYSMVELDAIAGTKTYFQKGGWHNGIVNKRAIYKAIEALDGEVLAVWKEL